jgi:hypothetical protein
MIIIMIIMIMIMIMIIMMIMMMIMILIKLETAIMGHIYKPGPGARRKGKI